MGRPADLIVLAMRYVRIDPGAAASVALDPLLASLDGTRDPAATKKMHGRYFCWPPGGRPDSQRTHRHARREARRRPTGRIKTATSVDDYCDALGAIIDALVLVLDAQPSLDDRWEQLAEALTLLEQLQPEPPLLHRLRAELGWWRRYHFRGPRWCGSHFTFPA